MNEQQLLNELAAVQTAAGRELRIDQEALLAEFRHDEEHEGTLGMKILSILGAFLATLFFLGFVFVAEIYDSSAGLMITGGILLGVGYFLNLGKVRSLVADAFSVSLTVCGYVLLLIGLAEPFDAETGLAVAGALLAGGLLLTHDNRIITFLATVAAAGWILFLFFDAGRTLAVHFYVAGCAGLLTAWFALEAPLLKTAPLLIRRYDGLRTGLIFALLIGAYYLSDFRWWLEEDRTPNWYASVALIPLTGWVAWRALGQFVTEPGQRVIYLAGVLTLLLPTIFAPAICAALLALLLAWQAGYRTGAAVATLALIYFISRYYYDLNLSLLTKSLVLMVSGVLFLIAYRLLHHKISAQ